MRYVFEPGASQVVVRMHAFLHKATAATDAVRGRVEVSSPGDPLAGPVEATAEVAVGDFEFANRIMAATARAWLDERPESVVRFDLTSAERAGTGAAVTGMLHLGDTSREIRTDATVDPRGDQLVIEGTWVLSQKAFGLKAPPGVKDRVDVEFRLVARADES